MFSHSYFPSRYFAPAYFPAPLAVFVPLPADWTYHNRRIVLWFQDIDGTAENIPLTVDFSRAKEILAGDTITGTPTFLFKIPNGSPAGAALPTVGTPVANAAKTQVQARVTFPANAPVGILYGGSCTVGTAQGNTLVCGGWIDFEGS